jgi:RNA polymerase sigma-70 factor, ECF subfamily
VSATCFDASFMLPRVDRPGDGASDAARELDRVLVERAQAGDRAAMGELLGKYGPGLYRSVLLPRLGSEAAAKDALSETYARVVAKIDRFTWQAVGFYPWLRTVALRVALDMLRARKRLLVWEAEDVAREVDAAGTATPVDQHLSDRRDRDAARAKVEWALERIHARYARAIRLRILEERPREEVAAEMQVTPATFDVLLHRAIQALKKTLETGEGRTDPIGAKKDERTPKERTKIPLGEGAKEAGDGDS